MGIMEEFKGRVISGPHIESTLKGEGRREAKYVISAIRQHRGHTILLKTFLEAPISLEVFLEVFLGSPICL